MAYMELFPRCNVSSNAQHHADNRYIHYTSCNRVNIKSFTIGRRSAAPCFPRFWIGTRLSTWVEWGKMWMDSFLFFCGWIAFFFFLKLKTLVKLCGIVYNFKPKCWNFCHEFYGCFMCLLKWKFQQTLITNPYCCAPN